MIKKPHIISILLLCAFTFFITKLHVFGYLDSVDYHSKNITSSKKTVTAGDRVTVRFLKISDNFKSSGYLDNLDSVEFIVGKGEVLPGLENAVHGMSINEKKSIFLPPEDAFGLENKSLIMEIPKTALPSESAVKPGMIIRFRSPDENIMPRKILKTKQNSVIVDFNHPLAGQSLEFTIQIIQIY